MTTPSPTHTLLIVARPNGDWSIVSHDQSPEQIAELQAKAVERGCRLVRYPLEVWRENPIVDFALAESVGIEGDYRL